MLRCWLGRSHQRHTWGWRWGEDGSPASHVSFLGWWLGNSKQNPFQRGSRIPGSPSQIFAHCWVGNSFTNRSSDSWIHFGSWVLVGEWGNEAEIQHGTSKISPQEEIHFKNKTSFSGSSRWSFFFGGGVGWIFIAQTINHTRCDGSLLLAFLAVFWEGGQNPSKSTKDRYNHHLLQAAPQPIGISLAITTPYNWPKINGFACGEKTLLIGLIYFTPLIIGF